MDTSALVVTVGAANANAYVSLDVADQYHLDRPAADTVWAEAFHPSKTQAILWATKLLDRLVTWVGQPVNYTQALLWPRYGLYYRNGDIIPSNVIPIELQWATAEYARHLMTAKVASNPGELKSQLEELADSARKLGVRSVGTPTVNITLEEGYGHSASQRIPTEVLDLMPEEWVYLLKGGPLVELLRG